MAKYKSRKRDFAQAVNDLLPEEEQVVQDEISQVPEEEVSEIIAEAETVAEENTPAEEDKVAENDVEIEKESSEEISEKLVAEKIETKSDDKKDVAASKKEKKENSMPQLERELRSSEEILSLGEDTTYITKGTIISGNIESDGDVEVQGRVDGNIRCSGKLIVTGRIVGDIDAGDLYAEGANITGEIRSAGVVKIAAGAVTVGNISADTANVAGAVKGDIDVKDSVIIDSTAVVVGNIKSKDVQINSGAIIDGFCKQTYSGVNVDQYFSDGIQDLK